jgi:UDP-glucuronate 4-epimerase
LYCDLCFGQPTSTNLRKNVSKNRIKYNKYTPSKKYGNYKFIKLNLEDHNGVDKVFRDGNFDIVCNLAAQAGVRYSLQNPRAYIDSNITGFLNILESCRKYEIKHLVYASSSSVYGLNNDLPFSVDDRTDSPASLYAVTKKTNELMAHSYSHLYGLATTGLRFFTVYGPWGRPDMAYYSFAISIIDGVPIDVYNNGDMMLDFTYIDDIIDGVMRVIDGHGKHKIYNMGNNSPVKLIDFIEVIEELLNKKAVKNFLPMQSGDVPATWAEIDDIIQPKTNIESGLNKLIEWFTAYHTPLLL